MKVLSGSADVGLSNGLLGVIGAYVKGAPVRVIRYEYPFNYARMMMAAAVLTEDVQASEVSESRPKAILFR